MQKKSGLSTREGQISSCVCNPGLTLCISHQRLLDQHFSSLFTSLESSFPPGHCLSLLEKLFPIALSSLINQAINTEERGLDGRKTVTAIGKRARKTGPFVMRSVEDANRVHNSHVHTEHICVVCVCIKLVVMCRLLFLFIYCTLNQCTWSMNCYI